jgi:hypothetical protein
MVKPWWQSKTVWLSVLIIAGGIAEFLMGVPVAAGAATIAAGILNIIIRTLTNTSLTK